MRALLISFLLIFVPLQASWAVIGGYCQHESGAASQHVGHHEHQHESNLADDPVDNVSPSNLTGFADSDCALCHASCNGILPETAVKALAEKAFRLSFALFDQAVSAIASPPERPNWPLLA